MNQETTEVPCPVGSCSGFVFARTTASGRILACDGCPSGHGDASIMGAWRAEADADVAKTEYEMDEIVRKLDPTAWAKDKLIEARRPQDVHISLADTSAVGTLPKFPTGFTENIEGRLTYLQGMVTLSGKASAGKSWFALASALSAAEEGWDVHYLAAEGSDVIIRRLLASRRSHENFSLHVIDPGLTSTELIDDITGWIIVPRTLLVIDSVSTLLGLMVAKPGSNKWDTQSALEMFLMRIRSLTRGYVSIINLSESNAAGETKGRSLDHRSDIAINFESCTEDREVKLVTVVKSWEGRTGALGYARVDWQAPGLSLSESPPGTDPPAPIPTVSLKTTSHQPEPEEPDWVKALNRGDLCR